ncbi:MAG: hypothetical protein H0W50_00445 [Parachlamydiaceae bacterium]|nr:hypothetical protein [Parachlamydiaceae bacterium]
MPLEQRKEDLKNQFPPFLFVLKEGPKFNKNLFDYSLCMMQIKPEGFKNYDSKIIINSRNKYDSKIG